MSTETYVSKLPDCDICKYEQDRKTEAHYDGKTVSGQWAAMCDPHFATRGTGLGTGKGQRLIVGERPEPTTAERIAAVHAALEAGDFDAAEEAMGDGDPAEYL